MDVKIDKFPDFHTDGIVVFILRKFSFNKLLQHLSELDRLISLTLLLFSDVVEH